MRVFFSARLLLLCFSLSIFCVAGVQATPVFINELHYDNNGADQEEGVELAGPAGTDLTGWQLLFYNGSNGRPYLSRTLSGVIEDLSNGFGVAAFGVAGLQNGAPDGIALVNAISEVIQFLSYEGQFVASEGVAEDMSSVDIGVAESPGTATGLSLQLGGVGQQASDFIWNAPAVSSFGAINPQQRFLPTVTGEISIPGTLLLILGAIGMMTFARSRTRAHGC